LEFVSVFVFTIIIGSCFVVRDGLINNFIVCLFADKVFLSNVIVAVHFAELGHSLVLVNLDYGE